MDWFDIFWALELHDDFRELRRRRRRERERRRDLDPEPECDRGREEGFGRVVSEFRERIRYRDPDDDFR